MKVKIVIGKVIYQEKSEFWEKLEDEVAEISGEDGVIVGGGHKRSHRCHEVWV